MQILHKLFGEKNFYGVAMLFILIGAFIVAVGGVEWAASMAYNLQFGWPAAKILGGFVVMGLGYIVLELELIRNKK